MHIISNNGLPGHPSKNEFDLPVLPSGITYLLKALNNNDIHYNQLAQELEMFPSIAIKIVAIANSAWSLPESPVTTLPDACSRVGLNIVRSVSIALCISQVFDPSLCPLFNAKKYWTSALLNAESASLCAQDNPEICNNTARLAGLLHNIGLLWLANQKPEETGSAILSVQSSQERSLSEALFERLGLDYYIVGGKLAMAMQLPDVIADIISTETAAGLMSDNLLINNHCYAKKLTASVLINAESEEPITNEYDEDPKYKKTMDILPRIQSMAESMFPG